MSTELIIVPSTAMDANKKTDRKEQTLIRIPAKNREFLKPDDNICIQANKKQINLMVFKAYTTDIQKIKTLELTEEQKLRVAFVTTDLFKLITNNTLKNKETVWISSALENVVIGADPEFLIYNKNNEIIPANNLLNHDGEIGSDGPMGEIRPDPATTPEALIHNIKLIINNQTYADFFNNYTCKSACYVKTTLRDYAVGGHIHIGNPAQILKVPIPEREYIFKTLNKIMDELLSIPLIKLDGIVGKNRRTQCNTSPNGGYGYFGEYRLAGENDNRRLEHRTLSGMWLSHPTIAVATIGTAKAIIDEVWQLLNHNNFKVEYAYPEKYKQSHIWKKEFTEWQNFELCKDIYCTESSDFLIKKLHESNQEEVNKTYLKKWLATMKKLSVYNTYQEYITLLYNILSLSANDIETATNRTLQENWIENKKFII